VVQKVPSKRNCLLLQLSFSKIKSEFQFSHSYLFVTHIIPFGEISTKNTSRILWTLFYPHFSILHVPLDKTGILGLCGAKKLIYRRVSSRSYIAFSPPSFTCLDTILVFLSLNPLLTPQLLKQPTCIIKKEGLKFLIHVI
jgi:hypothetical protein